MKSWTANPNCLTCKGKGTYDEAYFDAGDVRTRFDRKKCYDCYIDWLVQTNNGFAIYTPLSTMIFEKDTKMGMWKQYNIVQGESLWSDQYWDQDALEQFAFWVLDKPTEIEYTRNMPM